MSEKSLSTEKEARKVVRILLTGRKIGCAFKSGRRKFYILFVGMASKTMAETTVPKAGPSDKRRS